MRYALIDQSGKVFNIIEATEEEAQNLQPFWLHVEALDTVLEQPVSTGWAWDINNGFSPPDPEPLPPYSNFIDIGPFFDRFGSQKLPVLISQDQTVQALLKDIQIRKWIDLSLPEVQQSVQYLASIIPGIAPLIPTILATPVADHENLALRKLYFS